MDTQVNMIESTGILTLLKDLEKPSSHEQKVMIEMKRPSKNTHDIVPLNFPNNSLNKSDFCLQGTFDTQSTLMDNTTIFGLTLMASR